uniref:Uncharacterized protein n=2 Tax=Proboscia inermis TaxID=420281 RepID=A0A7S0CNW8_9STRA|mmetsp:Transcript_8430/g.8591  ORF Transcript_8430/g.8591 Transcript_8430/m.8591 type:complete len:106 (+) Transcript_8430:242-559(+)|eukprot:CAMPEP_0171309894 /NCGR_PEP_ID=MMETSP0816-20121228/20081_1 /TAXON_ID=420281 /ORGANISM="Proboscia inermis, Strain CCAP1064/1" /LENGTH=105 /DNA_ID=CAMNT_0011793725 /DNA_START=1834 /DNA_END=2151 /DNA_ORIENTATION=-
MRGVCHIGIVRKEISTDTFTYADKTHSGADKSYDTEVGSTLSLVYKMFRNKLDVLINFLLEKFQWVAKSSHDIPNTYAKILIEYMSSTFEYFAHMDKGSRARLLF